MDLVSIETELLTLLLAQCKPAGGAGKVGQKAELDDFHIDGKVTSEQLLGG